MAKDEKDRREVFELAMVAGPLDGAKLTWQGTPAALQALAYHQAGTYLPYMTDGRVVLMWTPEAR